MNYYKQKQYVAEVNEKDEVVGKVEKWEAHKKGILHRGYTALLMYEDQLILQYRKHPIFDNVFDLSFSSHPVFQNGILQKDEDAVLDGLEREWGIKQHDIQKPPKFIKSFYYKAFDDMGGYYEHEIDYFFSVELNRLPTINTDFAYGLIVLQKAHIGKLLDVRIRSLLAPWVDKMLHMNILT